MTWREFLFAPSPLWLVVGIALGIWLRNKWEE